MRSRTRKLILLLLAFCFVFLGPGAVLYAYGWRFDLSGFRLLKVGGIFLKDAPRDAAVRIGSRPAENIQHQLLGGAFLGNLLPATHTVFVEKPGFRLWEKKIPVSPAEVSETNNIVLIPENLEETYIINVPILDFWISGEDLIYRNSGGKYFLANLENLSEFVEMEEFMESTVETEGKDLAAIPDDPRLPNPRLISRASHYKDKGYVFLQYPGKVYFLELDSREPLNMELVADGVIKHVYADGRLYLLRPNGLSYLEI